MKRFAPFIAVLFAASCQTTSSPEQIVSQKYVHKYGFDLTAEEWDQRLQDGQVIATLKNGVTLIQTYENGNLHGPTTSTFPNSPTVEKILLYDQGNLLKETIQDMHGVPIQEEVYEFDDRVIHTSWSDKGTPLSVEEYRGKLLVDGKYYSLDHDLEGRVENGHGHRAKRDRFGLLISRDQIENGILASRTTYHPNGQIHTISHYDDYALHGDQKKFTSLGRPLMTLHWDHGILDGTKTVYRNGLKVAEIPYVQGKKHGIEYHYDDLANLIAEITWRNDKKHGCSKFYTEDSEETRWFFDNLTVSSAKFELLENRERMIAEFKQADNFFDE
ncbi:MAG TPA: toxin-antitoxin system YwqK family antitoxin [Chlamydiales bacterium]|nr:toxin-antitoxin system YwqK family antitoxin [Chlamydiales bacterium]